MGKFTNKPVINIVGWATVVILVGLSLMLLITSFL